MKAKIGKYSSVCWSDFVVVDETSPTGLRWSESVKQRGNRQPGKVCGIKDSKGWRFSINRQYYRVHRVIIEILYGIPEDKIVDHIDGNPYNNKLENLRIVTHKENNQNTKKSPKNTSGFAGVFPWKDKHDRVTAYYATWVGLDGKQKRKSFAFSHYTEQGALELAVEFRKQKIQELIQQGMSYTSRHGL